MVKWNLGITSLQVKNRNHSTQKNGHCRIPPCPSQYNACTAHLESRQENDWRVDMLIRNRQIWSLIQLQRIRTSLTQYHDTKKSGPTQPCLCVGMWPHKQKNMQQACPFTCSYFPYNHRFSHRLVRCALRRLRKATASCAEDTTITCSATQVLTYCSNEFVILSYMLTISYNCLQ